MKTHLNINITYNKFLMAQKRLEEALVILKNHPERFKKQRKLAYAPLLKKETRKFDLTQEITYSVVVGFFIAQFFIVYFF